MKEDNKKDRRIQHNSHIITVMLNKYREQFLKEEAALRALLRSTGSD
jgi:hypothetical protein